MTRQGFVASNVCDFPPAADSAINTTTTRTNLWNIALWTAIAAFEPKAGSAYRLQAGGTIGTTGTPTIIFTPTYGQSATPASNINLGSSITLTLGNNLSNVPWFAEFVFGFRSIGNAASGASAVGAGFVVIGGPAATASQVVAIGGTLTTSADHTTAQGLGLDVTWGTSSASNTIVSQWKLLQSLT